MRMEQVVSPPKMLAVGVPAKQGAPSCPWGGPATPPECEWVISTQQQQQQQLLQPQHHRDPASATAGPHHDAAAAAAAAAAEEEEECVAAGVTAVTRPATSWSDADLAALQQLVQSRNRFVCLQLVTMAQEQARKLQQAARTHDAAGQLQAALVHLSTLRAAGQLVAAALFYPRMTNKDGAVWPHVYVDLLCCNTPGKGLGSLLLAHIERHVWRHQHALTRALLAAHAAGASAGSDCSGPPAYAGGATATAGSGGRGDAAVGCGSDCSCTSDACSDSDSWGHDATCLTPTACSSQRRPPGTPTSTYVAPGAAWHQQQQQQQPGPARGPATAAPPPLHGIKLLSVESAMAFYAKNSYAAPDKHHELFKGMPALAEACAAAVNAKQLLQ